jgi:hypothetical protein
MFRALLNEARETWVRRANFGAREPGIARSDDPPTAESP